MVGWCGWQVPESAQGVVELGGAYEGRADSHGVATRPLPLISDADQANFGLLWHPPQCLILSAIYLPAALSLSVRSSNRYRRKQNRCNR